MKLQKCTVALLLMLTSLFVSGCLAPNAITSTSQPELPTALSRLLGDSQDNPIPMASIIASMNYLDMLAWPDGSSVHWQRVCSIKVPLELQTVNTPTTPWKRIKHFFGVREVEGPILDCYRLSDDHGHTRKLWINPYAGYNLNVPPDGFIFR